MCSPNFMAIHAIDSKICCLAIKFGTDGSQASLIPVWAKRLSGFLNDDDVVKCF